MPLSSVELVARINVWRREKNAVIMAHHYVREEVQDIADCVADSLQLAQEAAKTSADVIVLCGVHFMAETAALISPDKKVLSPDLNAGCAMANMLTEEELCDLRAEHPRALVVTYINSTAAIKAQSDICCTSANAVAVVKSLPADREIIFIPDRNLGAYVAKRAGRDLILWRDGFCPTHERMLPTFVETARREHPNAKLVVHPETRPAVAAVADFVGSTAGIFRYCRESSAAEFIIGTEIGVLPRLRRENPDKQFYPLTETADCPNMKLITLAKIARCLEREEPVVRVKPEIAARARAPIEKMLKVKS
ncbi:quinolinate synthase A [Planctomycetales bacterium]|nr:quinolinate synthase A [Planctomycetales bacterium]GHS99443.1 quinolinate synthase A [Planctomycetales bacterium]GHT06208.1 quinolinate synthase A [Planctomycetales bacterium]